jgi:hypothetical protein
VVPRLVEGAAAAADTASTDVDYDNDAKLQGDRGCRGCDGDTANRVGGAGHARKRRYGPMALRRGHVASLTTAPMWLPKTSNRNGHNLFVPFTPGA